MHGNTDRTCILTATLALVLAGLVADAPAQALDGLHTGALRLSADPSDALASMKLEPEAQRTPQAVTEIAGDVWRIAPGEALAVTITLPPRFASGLITVTELGMGDAPEGAALVVELNGEKAERALAPVGVPVPHHLSALSAQLKPGRNTLTIRNPNDAGAAGVLDVELRYALRPPTGEGSTRAFVQPLPWDGSGDPAQREPKTPDPSTLPPEKTVALTLISPAPGQMFAADGEVVIEWEAADFPEGSGVAVWYRSGAGPWKPVPGAEAVPFNAPTMRGERGRFTWKPGEAIDDLRIGLGYAARARREPRRWVVGGEGGPSTIAAALAGAQDGDTVVLSPGTYAEAVVLYHDVTLVGEDGERCVIASPALRGVVVAEGVKATVQNLTIDGTLRMDEQADAWGLHLPGARATVRRVTIRNTYMGVVANWDAEAALSDVVIDGTVWGVQSTRGAQTTLERATVKLVEDGESTGLAARDGGVLTASEVTIAGPGTKADAGLGAMAAHEGSALTLRDATIDGVSAGVLATEKASVTLEKVTARGDKERTGSNDGLTVNLGATATATDSAFAGFRQAGALAIGEGAALTLNRCKLEHNYHYGLLAGNGAALDIANSSFDHNRVDGARIVRGARGSLARNRFQHNTWGLMVTEDPGPLDLRDNDASDNQAYGYSFPGGLGSNRGANNGRGLHRNQ